MNPKMKSAIEKITLNDATFSNEVIEPTYVNFFYGKNGAGKSTIARTFKANDERLQWQAGKASTDYDVLVYDTDFINANLRNYGNLAGVFTVNETNIAIQEQVDTLNAERKKMGEEYNGHKAAIDQKTADKNTALSTFQSDCWSKSAEARTLFDEAIKGKKKAALFAQEILAITPVAHDVEDLKTLYGTVFSGDAQQYNMLSKAGKVTYASLPGYELMGKPISSSSDTDFAKFIKALKATDWVRSGHTHFAGQTDGKCPYCQQKLPSNFDKEIAACFDAQYQDDISAINAFQRTYESEMDSVVATLEGNVSAAMPELDLSEYEVKVQLLVDAITINKQRIAAKIKEPTSIASLEDTDSLLIEIGTLIDGFNKKIKENNEIVRDLKTKKVLCKKQVWEYLAELLKADVAAYNKALSDLDTEIKALKDKMEQLKKDATAKKKEANELNKQIVNTEATIDSINVLLDNSGFEGFHLRAKDGVANTYEVIRPDGTVAEKLSEGERNFIACGTGGMLSTSYNFIKRYNPTADVRLFGQEINPESYAICLAEMLIKGQNAENICYQDTMKKDRFAETKMRFVIENPPFGTPWGGKDAAEGVEKAVNDEYAKGFEGRWGAGLPGSGDMQMLFLQSAIDKMDDNFGRAAIIENGSPLFSGGTASGESQIRRWMLENDLIEAIIALPTDLFYNTGIATYIWVLSKNKRAERKGKIQLIDASSFFHKLRKALGDKKNEISPEDRSTVTKLYAEFAENEYCKIYDNEEFIYREYTVMQPLQRSYAITEERIEAMLSKGALSSLYDQAKVNELENAEELTGKEQKKLESFQNNQALYDEIITTLKAVTSEQVYNSPTEFMPVLTKALASATSDKKLLDKIANGLSIMDKNAEIQRDRKGRIIYDKETKDTELVKWEESIEDYMAREVLPHIPDAAAFFEEDLGKKKPVIKTGAEIPFTRYFYKYQASTPSEELETKFMELEFSVSKRVAKLFE